MTRSKISPDRFCEQWSVAPAKLLRWIAYGTVPAPLIIDTIVRWTEEVLEQWEADGFPTCDPPSLEQLRAIRVALLCERFNKDPEDFDNGQIAPTENAIQHRD